MLLWRRLRRNPVGLTGAIIVALLMFMVIAPGLSAPGDPSEMAPFERLRPPSAEHIFGTDQFGRDLYTRVVHGARISLTASLTVVAVALAVGTCVGAVSGWVGGRVDQWVMRLVDVFLAFPFLILALAITALLGRGLQNAVIGLAAVWWAQYARLVRNQVLLLREMVYVEAAVSLGQSPFKLLLRHVLPGAVPSLFVQASLDVGQAIMSTASISFIGLGAAPPSPEWGAMITDSRSFMIDFWWFPTFPGLAILLSVLAFNLLGDGLRDILDPKLKN